MGPLDRLSEIFFRDDPGLARTRTCKDYLVIAGGYGLFLFGIENYSLMIGVIGEKGRGSDYCMRSLNEPKTPYRFCGKKGPRYMEKYTTEWRAQPKDQQQVRRICRTCYNEAVKAEQTASVPLPWASRSSGAAG